MNICCCLKNLTLSMTLNIYLSGMIKQELIGLVMWVALTSIWAGMINRAFQSVGEEYFGVIERAIDGYLFLPDWQGS